jgi:alpha-glucosidase
VPALIHRDMTLLPVDAQVLAYERSHAGQRVRCTLNLSGRPARLPLPAHRGAAVLLEGSSVDGATLKGRQLQFQPWGSAFVSLA